MRISFDKFRQIFWMIIALIFVSILFVYVISNIYEYKTENTRLGKLITRTNKITGKTTYKAVTKSGESDWQTLKNLTNKKQPQK